MMGVMDRRADATARPLSAAEQRALASFLAGRLPAGQLQAELARARSAPAFAPVTAAPVAALHAAA
jgi:hypothetical protein